jgi:hypothetical protein
MADIEEKPFWETAQPVAKVGENEQPFWEAAKPVAKVGDDAYSSEEWEPPTKNKAGQTLTPEARRMEKLVHDVQTKKGSDWVQGVDESIRSLAHGMYKSAVGGWKGIGKLVSGGTLGSAVEAIEKEQAGTLQPVTAEGKLLTNIAGEALNAPTKMATMASEDTGKALGVSDKTQAKMDLVAETAPSIIPMAKPLVSALKPSSAVAKAATRTAAQEAAAEGLSTAGAKKVYAAMKDMSPEELKDLAHGADIAAKAKVPYVVGENAKEGSALQTLIEKADKNSNIIKSHVRNRPEVIRDAAKAHLKRIGEDVGTQTAVNAVEEGATNVIKDITRTERTEKASPLYEAQKLKEADARDAANFQADRSAKIEAGQTWVENALQHAGKSYQISHEMANKANQLGAKMNEWAAKDAGGLAALEGEGGALRTTTTVEPPIKSKLQQKIDAKKGVAQREPTVLPESPENARANYLDMAEQHKEATFDAIKEMEARKAHIETWNNERMLAQNAIDEVNLPAIRSGADKLVSSLNKKIEGAGDTADGAMLKELRDAIAPNGVPHKYISQFESTHQHFKDVLSLKLLAEKDAKTRARVLEGPLKELDKFITDASPDIAAGRELYKTATEQVVNPLIKGVVGKLAKTGASETAEAQIGRIMSELNGKYATPDRIRFAADKLTAIDPEIVPNWVRAHLEDMYAEAAKQTTAKSDPTFSKKFLGALNAGGELGETANRGGQATVAASIESAAKASGLEAREAHLAARGFLDFMDTMKNTSKIENLGRQEMAEGRGAKGVTAAGAKIAMRPVVGTLQTVGDIASSIFQKDQWNNISKVVTSADGARKLALLAKVGKESVEGSGIIKSLLSDAKNAAERVGREAAEKSVVKGIARGVAADQMRNREPITVEVNGTANQNNEGAK